MPSLIIQKKIIHIFRVSVVIGNEHFLGFLKRSPLKNPPQRGVCISWCEMHDYMTNRHLVPISRAPTEHCMGDRACNPIPDGVTDNCVNRERGLSGPPLEMFLPNLKMGVYPEISWQE